MPDIIDLDVEYRSSTLFDDDAIDALYMSEERPDWLMRRVRSWYRLSERYADVIDDARNGEKSWA